MNCIQTIAHLSLYLHPTIPTIGLLILLISNILNTFIAAFWIYSDEPWMFQFMAVIMGIAGASYIIGCSYTPQRVRCSVEC